MFSFFFQFRDQGKPVGLAKRMDIPRAVLNLKTFATGQCHLLETSNELVEAGVINYTMRSPVGVAGLMFVPFTFLMNFLALLTLSCQPDLANLVILGVTHFFINRHRAFVFSPYFYYFHVSFSQRSTHFF